VNLTILVVMEDLKPLAPPIRFGIFEVDLRAGELRRQGLKVKLQEQPFQILAMLLDCPGEVITREEVQRKLWPVNTFVDFDSGLNRAMNRLREALGDSADSPRFVETLPGRGYRFIARVERLGVHTRVKPSEPPRIESLAVLPLENLSADAAQDYFADGMTDELITSIAKIASLRVISRTSIMQYKGARKSLALIARELGVDAILEGTVLHSGRRVRITAQLVRTRDDRHLWTEKYERDLGDILMLQSEVAQAISGQLQIKLTPQEHSRLSQGHSVLPEAYEAYLRGVFFRNKWTDKSLFKSIELFTEANRLDPTFARGYAGLSQSYCALGILGSLPAFEVYPKAKAAALRALELDETVAEAHNSLADVRKGFDWDWAAAQAEYERALELNPSDAMTHMWYADWLSKMGRHAEAVAKAGRARALAPVSVDCCSFLGLILYRSRRYQEALAECRKAIELDPYYPVGHWFLGLIYQQTGELPAAIAALNTAANLSDAPMYRALLGHAYALAGDTVKALSTIDDLNTLSRRKYVSPLDIAVVYTGIGDRNSAFEWLEKACQERSMRIQELPDPIFDSLRLDVRFNDLMQRIGLPI
jgi:TolB-like protein/Tfp pilus assembly protein PilF